MDHEVKDIGMVDLKHEFKKTTSIIIALHQIFFCRWQDKCSVEMAL